MRLPSKRTLGLVVIPLLVPIVFLVSRRPDRPPVGVELVELAGPLHVGVNTDSADFVSVALRPGKLFDDREPLQSRPVVVVAAALASLPLRPLLRIADPASRIDTTVARRALAPGGDADVNDAMAAYLVYIAINALLLLGSLVVFWRAVGPGPKWWALAPLALVVAGNQVVKAFFWTPHLQIFNILVPVVAVEAARRTLDRPLASWRQSALVGLALGLSALAYGAAVIIVVAVVAAQVLGRRPRRLSPLLPLVLAFAAVVGAWVVVVEAVSGGFYNHEVRVYRQFVWIVDAIRGGDIGAAVARNLHLFIDTTIPVVWLPVAVLAVIALCSMRAPLSAGSRQRLAGAAIGFASAALFYAPLGLYASRLSWSLVPPVLVATGVLAQRVVDDRWRPMAWVCAVVVAVEGVGSLAAELIRRGPYG